MYDTIKNALSKVPEVKSKICYRSKRIALFDTKIIFVAILSIFAIAPVFAGEEDMLNEEVPRELSLKNGLSGDMTITSNYVYRGISQTNGNATLQGGFDYTGDSHFYVGAWASGISLFRTLYQETGGAEGAANSRIEADVYGGYQNKVGRNFFYDIGILRYNLPGLYAGTQADTTELFSELKYKWIAAKYSYSIGNTFANPNTSGTNYFEINAIKHFEPADVSLAGHYGRQTYQGAGNSPNGNSLSYSDYRISVTKEFADEYELSLAYSNTNATAAYTLLGKNMAGKEVAISLSRFF